MDFSDEWILWSISEYQNIRRPESLFPFPFSLFPYIWYTEISSRPDPLFTCNMPVTMPEESVSEPTHADASASPDPQERRKRRLRRSRVVLLLSFVVLILLLWYIGV